MPLRFKLGEWIVLLDACTHDTILPVERISDYLDSFRSINDNFEKKQIAYLAVASTKLLSTPTTPDWLPKSENFAWGRFFRTLTDTVNDSTRAGMLDYPSFSWPFTGFENLDIPIPLEVIQEDRLFALVIENPTESSFVQIFLYIIFLATRWHVEHGHLCLHSSAVAREKKGFLFLGASDAGKTTVAELSDLVGFSVLGDDLNFVLRESPGHYRLTAAPSPKPFPIGYSMSRPKLRGMFKLVQDNKNYLMPLSPLQTAKVLFDSFRQVPKSSNFSGRMFGLGLQTIADIARHIPGYELHFRKSSDFWKLIDDQFPD
jgi:hypothetical protein